MYDTRDYPLGELDYKALSLAVIRQALYDAFLEPYPYNVQAQDWLLGKSRYVWFEFWCENAGMTPDGVTKRVQEILSNPELLNKTKALLKTPLEFWSDHQK